MDDLPTIQVVEDDAILAKDMCGCLRELGYYPLRPVSSITDALVACRRERPDVVLIDIMLSDGGDGIQLGALLKKRYQLRIIYVTSLRDRETIHQASRTQADGYLMKPVGSDSLFATIEVALQRTESSMAKEEHGARVPMRIRRVIAHIEERLADNITTDALARVAGLSRDHFARSFRQSIGETPHNYLVDRRISQARRLLETTDGRVVEVARQCGYESLSYFTTLFRRRVGVSPAAYRRANR